MTATAVTAADYRGELITGKRWRRAVEVVIANPYLGVPHIWFKEEVVTDLDGRKSTMSVGVLGTDVDLTEPIALVNPETGEALGTSVTHMDVYVALYSLYRALGATRDAAEVNA